jgi:hypothetical protein
MGESSVELLARVQQKYRWDKATTGAGTYDVQQFYFYSASVILLLCLRNPRLRLSKYFRRTRHGCRPDS